jgi:4-alpha-glucanotransferase
LTTHDLEPGRRAGVQAPLFSLASSESWGIGEIGDLVTLFDWLSTAGQRLLQLLPVHELAPGEVSPYSALSAMAIDPQYVTLGELEDFHDIGGEEALEAPLRDDLAAVRASPRVDYSAVRALKEVALRRSFAHFEEQHWRIGTARADALRAYIADEGWWLNDYALFRALRAELGERPWPEWPSPLRDRLPLALNTALVRLARDVLFRQYVQWVVGTEWRAMREGAVDVALFGDLPFMVSPDSADVWTRQDEFRMDTSIGAPPDAFSDTGQDWRLPACRWSAVAAGGFSWLRDRGRRAAALYDGYRVDHVVGFYRTYYRAAGRNEGAFTPTDEREQVALGERVLAVLSRPGVTLIAEDLGVVPDFVKNSLAGLGIPGYKVLRWERARQIEGQPFHDPRAYPAASVATTGTHDTEPIVVWWHTAPHAERAAALAIPAVAERLSPNERTSAAADDNLSAHTREALLWALYASGSDTLILPIQDLFGWAGRVNRPGTIDDGNWTWRMPWRVDRLLAEPEARTRAAALRAWRDESGR